MADVETNRAILIRVKDPGAVARGQGALASFAQSAVPATIEKKVYDSIADELGQALREKHIDVDVSVVNPRMWQPADDNNHLFSDLGYSLGVVGALAIIWSIFKK